MVKNVSKVVYQPDTQSTDSYIVIVNADEFKKWHDGAFDVFHSNQGAQGHLNRASKQQLDSVFGSSNETDCVTQILEKGSLQITAGGNNKYGSTNDAQSGHNMTSRGAGGAGGR
ncbi:unnamed protein product [Tilletia controversa]|uniref:Ribosome maturation protein SDO1/SBDS N-terminal domain-containing protein n=1 Tax=Tilletia caries TaxID=13290 RepID=A0A177UV88_9BASI|nr:hypothetical protein CF336_g7734 [Tilletia laevis]KAE8246802.1 hypothetical protein A4X03_0g7209 [Tilletia caries]CAD6956865.1 unnamed protein product [Tilletia controversa]KAE8187301.1 hypothetical protein CF335_g7212 [Tilletia laevis]CAD6892552.1 unnamed protein product [Tilletia caries]